jgi:ABC-2 type transport system ATP-binding protein
MCASRSKMAAKARSVVVVVDSSSKGSLIEARALRVDVDGAPDIDGLSFVSTARNGESAVVLGAPRALFDAAAGLVKPSSGELLVAGEIAADAAKRGAVASAPLTSKLPPKWTLGEYATWSARLAGKSKLLASNGAHRALGLLDLRDDADTKLEIVRPHVRALVPLAAALATGAEMILLEDPTSQLPGDIARALSRRIVAALSETSWLLFSGRIALDSPFALHAEEAIVVSGTKVEQGAVAEVAAREGSYAVRIHGEARTFARLVTSKGGTTRGDGDDLLIDLGNALRTHDLFDLAEEAHSVIVELRPLARAFA